VRSKKIKIYPKKENQSLLNRYLGLSRYWFNQAIEYLRQPDTKAYLPEVRKIQKNEHPIWALDCPQRVREHAISDACKAVKNAKSKYHSGNGFQRVSFRSKKNPSQYFGFDLVSLNDSFIFKQKKYKGEFYASESFRHELEGIRIKRENGRWFLIIPQRRHIKVPENQRLKYVALDPGIRTFTSFFSPEVFGKIGESDFRQIFRLCLSMDRLISKTSKVRCKTRRRMKKALQRIRWRIRNLIDELHRKTAHFLVTRFDVVFIPTFETSEMVTTLRSKTARSMLNFAHYRFKQFLKTKGEEYSCEVVEVSEAYTSRTCSFCGKVHNIGSKKTLRCRCGVSVDRDLNGARGILLRALMVTSH